MSFESQDRSRFAALAIADAEGGYPILITGNRDLPMLGKMVGKTYLNGDYLLPDGAWKDLSSLAKEFRKTAKRHGISLDGTLDIERIKKLDNNPNDLSDREIGAYIGGLILAANSRMAVGEHNRVVPVSVLGSVGDLRDFTPRHIEVAVEIASQLLGDNFPVESSKNTLEDSSLKRLIDLLSAL